jgi:hypothetical protein
MCTRRAIALLFDGRLPVVSFLDRERAVWVKHALNSTRHGDTATPYKSTGLVIETDWNRSEVIHTKRT